MLFSYTVNLTVGDVSIHKMLLFNVNKHTNQTRVSVDLLDSLTT